MFNRIYIDEHCSYISSVFFVFFTVEKKKSILAVGAGIWEATKIITKNTYRIAKIKVERENSVEEYTDVSNYSRFV